MLKLNVNTNFVNQEITLSDKSTGQLSGVRIPSTMGQQDVQWTFISTGRKHEGFVFTGQLSDGQVINSFNNEDQYKIHLMNK
ncbi:hypothetical protein MOO46_02605 [Apilactobacillus apisilvae]|uniref:Uncharacterized protein n=1 Tax=Apilactobacillus apisilvae TaxID=2923364 RepID=A0ABY4PI30_9LACO|nr:hypothetical protein [Apilactobacillus apisilvae]UQS85496.1 hypothetical protein MOO46_02605 [Apilactobacillus apisilvae]